MGEVTGPWCRFPSLLSYECINSFEFLRYRYRITLLVESSAYGLELPLITKLRKGGLCPKGNPSHLRLPGKDSRRHLLVELPIPLRNISVGEFFIRDRHQLRRLALILPRGHEVAHQRIFVQRCLTGMAFTTRRDESNRAPAAGRVILKLRCLWRKPKGVLLLCELDKLVIEARGSSLAEALGLSGLLGLFFLPDLCLLLLE